VSELWLTKTKISFVAVSAVLALSLVARPPISSVGALLPEITLKLGLSPLQSGIIASTPVFIFGFGAFLSPWLARRYGVNHSLFLSAILLSASLLIRVMGDYSFLAVGTFGVGLSIAVINVLLPNVIRTEFKDHIALATGVYTALFGLMASVAATISVPLSAALGGWQMALGVWVLLALFALFSWIPLLRGRDPHQISQIHSSGKERRAVLSSPMGLAIMGFFGFQSAGFYLVLNWLPTILVDYGFDEATAGSLLGLTTIVGVPLAVVFSFFIKRITHLGWAALAISAFSSLGYVVLLQGGGLVVIGCLMIGIGQSMTFPLSLTLISSRPANQVQVTELSTWGQGLGYLFAALATFAAGLLRDLTSGWTVSLLLILGITVVQAGIGYVAGRPGRIEAAK
jgi:CP family cyanate transporter-like MFS transporter